MTEMSTCFWHTRTLDSYLDSWKPAKKNDMTVANVFFVSVSVPSASHTQPLRQLMRMANVVSLSSFFGSSCFDNALLAICYVANIRPIHAARRVVGLPNYAQLCGANTYNGLSKNFPQQEPA
jgi:hypothetical protein